MLSLTDQIGVGNTQLRQHRSLETFHGLGLIIAYVVVSEKMQNTVHRQMLQMVRERLALLSGFANANSECQSHVTDKIFRVRQGRKGQDIGGRVLVPKACIQVAHQGVVGEQDSQARLPSRHGMKDHGR